MFHTAQLIIERIREPRTKPDSRYRAVHAVCGLPPDSYFTTRSQPPSM